jgi:hypothetical protein
MSLFWTFLRGISGYAGQRSLDEGAENVCLADGSFEPRCRLAAFSLERAAESLRILFERLQPNVPVKRGIGGFQAANPRIGLVCHRCTFDRFRPGHAYRLLYPAQGRKRRAFE